MEYYNNILCVSAAELLNGVIPVTTYQNLAPRGFANIVRRACKGQTALIELNSLPTHIKEKVTAKYGSPQEQAVTKPFNDKIVPDAKAITYYSNYMLADGRHLPEANQKEYATNASVFNAVHEILTNARDARKSLGGTLKKPWAKVLIAINNIRDEHKHTLPSKERPLQRSYKKYIETGYEALVSGKFCNDNSRKVTAAIENLIMSIYSMPNKPFSVDVHTIYSQFLAGTIQVVDQKTGEIFDKEKFVRNGKPVEITSMTVWNYLNQPNNRAIVDKVRSGVHRYNTTHRPHHHRHAPE